VKGRTRLKPLKSLTQPGLIVLTATKLPFTNNRDVLDTITAAEGASGGSAGPL